MAIHLLKKQKDHLTSKAKKFSLGSLFLFCLVDKHWDSYFVYGVCSRHFQEMKMSKVLPVIPIKSSTFINVDKNAFISL